MIKHYVNLISVNITSAMRPGIVEIQSKSYEKNLHVMTWNSVMGFISSLALFLPVVCILALRLGSYRTFPALLAYYSMVFIYNLFTEHYITVNDTWVQNFGLFNNLLDAPLMLFFLNYFNTTPVFTKRMRVVIGVFILFEAAIVIWQGYNTKAISIILGPGVLIVFGFCLYFFINQAKLAIMNRKATGKALMTAALLFAYGCFGIIYLIYYVFKTKDVANTFLVYFMVTTFSSLLMCAGIFIERKRVQKLNELKVTRKELSMIYKEPVTTNAAIKRAILDFDKEQWN